MPSESAKYRQNLKRNHPEQYQEYLEKQRLRNTKRRKELGELRKKAHPSKSNKKIVQRYKENSRDRQKRYREKKKAATSSDCNNKEERMPLNYQRKSDSGRWDVSAMESAVQCVRGKQMGVKLAARQFKVPATILQKKAKNNEPVIPPVIGRKSTLGDDVEKDLYAKLRNMESHGFILYPQGLCEMAFEIAERNGLKHNFNVQKKAAGRDWMRRFLNRYPDLLIGKSKGVSQQVCVESAANASVENHLVEKGMDLQKVVALIETSNVEFVRIELCDMYGISRSKIVPARHFPRTITDGTAFSLGVFAWDPVCSLIPGTGLLEEVGYCDMTIHPDLETFRVIPWLENTARVLVDCTFNGAPVPQDPRHIARTQLGKLEHMGLSLFSAHEYEFYVREKSGKMLSDFGGESLTITASEHSTLVYKLMRELTRVGIDVEAFHSEDGAGQLEVTFRPSFGLKAADNAHTFRTSVKEICQSQGYTASFMSKPFEGIVGSSCHFCHSLWDLEGRQSQLYDEESNWKLSETGQHWIAGLLEHAPAIALLCAPTINCLKRFQPETFAPVNATWGIDNRTAAIRFKVDGSSGTYIENRMGASASNPYLLLAASVAAGIDGIERKLKLTEPMTDSAYNPKLVSKNVKKLPTTLPEAIQNFVEDDLMFDTFGAEFIKTFVALKQHEMKRELEAKAKGNLKDWEMDFFFKIL